eukprot:TRINITY_DN21330_c0_g1_i1.p1 TRINITY_DN21330_c0_g1~~TRINITY_DN21330_c0_g1_i1.p1  ORF type:complete len:235 (-),score=57.33 TRINITY_DN21330_c0_g1_i1:95-799(-)
MASKGLCKSFNGLKGWGFIDHDGLDVFVHIKDCAAGSQPAKGDTLSFDVEESSPGKYKAKNVSGGSATREQQDGMNGAATPVEGTGTVSGTVKSFNATKGFGFICTEDGTDVFVHSKACVGTSLNVGDRVKFDLEPSQSKPGSFQAKNVTGGTAPLHANGMNMMGQGYAPMWGYGGMDGYGYGGYGNPYAMGGMKGGYGYSGMGMGGMGMGMGGMGMGMGMGGMGMGMKGGKGW